MTNDAPLFRQTEERRSPPVYALQIPFSSQNRSTFRPAMLLLADSAVLKINSTIKIGIEEVKRGRRVFETWRQEYFTSYFIIKSFKT